MAAFWILAAALGGLGAVAAGAAASHLAGADGHALELLRIAAQYEMYHALALLAVGLLAGAAKGGADWLLAAAGWCFLLGILLFSGSLYALALTGLPEFAAVTPTGGLAFMIGWVALAVFSARRLQRGA